MRVERRLLPAPRRHRFLSYLLSRGSNGAAEEKSRTAQRAAGVRPPGAYGKIPAARLEPLAAKRPALPGRLLFGHLIRPGLRRDVARIHAFAVLPVHVF